MSQPPVSIAVEQASAQYASVTEQIDECTTTITQAQTNIRSLQDAIVQQRDLIKRQTAQRAKLRRKKNIFARARFELQQVDEE
jgi:predicted RNase H-like nuclease (RuvC/YqgF family)